MAALFASIAQDYQAGRQAAFESHREAVANLMLDMIRAEAPDFLVLEMVGENQRAVLKDFRAELLRAVRRVAVRPVPPVLRSRAGQIEVANFLKDVPGAIQTPEQAIEIVTTGQITPLYRASRAAIERIRWENERMAEGTPVEAKQDDPKLDPVTQQMVPGDQYEITPGVPVLPTDNPFLHIPEHVAELSAPGALERPEIRKALLAHIRWHLRVYRTMPPDLAATLKIPPPQAVAAAAQPKPNKDMPGGDLKAGKLTERAADTGIGLPQPAQPPEPQLQ
jgi:hypothetical protein